MGNQRQHGARWTTGVAEKPAQRVRTDARARQIQAFLTPGVLPGRGGPFVGRPAADRLCALLDAIGVEDVQVSPLMPPILWGERPRYPRYLAVGIRPHKAA